MTCEDGVAAHSGYPSDGGGSIPASSLHFWLDETDAATSLVRQFHYSRRWPSNVQLVVTAHVAGGLFGNKGDAVAAVVFSIPGTRWKEPVWELSRLVRGHSPVPLSALIAMGCRKAKSRGADLVVSFADRTQGHHGGVYQAAGWAYDGLRERTMDGIIVAGKFIPGRSANSRWGTRSPERLAALGVIAEPHYDDGKHCYWRALTPAGAARAVRLGLSANAYPRKAA